MNFKKQPLKGVEIHGAPQVGTRTVNILMGEHANEFVRGDIMDANAVLQAFDEFKGNVDTDHDTLEELVNKINANTEEISNVNTQIQKEVNDRTSADNNTITTLDQKIKAVTAIINGKQDKIIPNRIDATGIDAADIEQLRTIVNNLINALATSGLVSTNLQG